jgi:hypothetical protein
VALFTPRDAKTPPRPKAESRGGSLNHHTMLEIQPRLRENNLDLPSGRRNFDDVRHPWSGFCFRPDHGARRVCSCGCCGRVTAAVLRRLTL